MSGLTARLFSRRCPRQLRWRIDPVRAGGASGALLASGPLPLMIDSLGGTGIRRYWLVKIQLRPRIGCWPDRPVHVCDCTPVPRHIACAQLALRNAKHAQRPAIKPRLISGTERLYSADCVVVPSSSVLLAFQQLKLHSIVAVESPTDHCLALSVTMSAWPYRPAAQRC